MRFLIPLLLCAALHAQDAATVKKLMDASSPYRLTKQDFSLLAADSGARAFDVYSTHHMLENGGRELILPSAISDHTWSMTAFSAGMVGADYVLLKTLGRKHPRLVRTALWIGVGGTVAWSARNMTIETHGTPWRKVP